MPMTASRRPGSAILAALLGILLASPAGAASKPKTSEAIWAERIEAGCKADAKKYYSAFQFKKRRVFVQNCIERANR